MRSLMGVSAVVGAVVWHRLGREWRHFILGLTVETIRRHPWDA